MKKYTTGGPVDTRLLDPDTIDPLSERLKHDPPGSVFEARTKAAIAMLRHDAGRAIDAALSALDIPTFKMPSLLQWIGEQVGYYRQMQDDAPRNSEQIKGVQRIAEAIRQAREVLSYEYLPPVAEAIANEITRQTRQGQFYYQVAGQVQNELLHLGSVLDRVAADMLEAPATPGAKPKRERDALLNALVTRLQEESGESLEACCDATREILAVCAIKTPADPQDVAKAIRAFRQTGGKIA